MKCKSKKSSLIYTQPSKSKLSKAKSVIKKTGKIIGSIIALTILMTLIFSFWVAPVIVTIIPNFFENIVNINWNNSSFKSVPELITYLRSDTVSDNKYVSGYTCIDFARDFIKQARDNDYQCFTFCGLFGDELSQFNKAVGSIGRYITLSAINTGHAVVKTSINGTELIIDPQTDIVMTAKDFNVLYRGEIWQK